MARAQGARAQMAVGFETVYGTPPAAGRFWRVPFASATLGSEQPLLSSELLGYGRDPLPPVRDAINADGNVVIPIDLRFLGIWLKALFGNPTTTGTAPTFTHTFESGEYGLPSMAIEIGNPEVPSFRMMRGVKANSLQWSMARSGLVTGTIACIAQGEDPSTAASAAGELEELAQLRFGSFNGSIERNGAVLGNVTAGSVTYTNNLDRVETIRADGLIDGADEGIAALTGDITVRFADTVLLAQARSGGPCELTFGYTLPTGELFEIVAHSVYVPRPRIENSGPGGVSVTFAWQAALDSTLGRMATVRLVNDQPNYTPPT